MRPRQFKQFHEEWRALRSKLLSEEWRTPDAWDGPAPIPPSPGIYLLMVSDKQCVSGVHRVAYVGKSNNLEQRFVGHKVIQAIKRRNKNLSVQRWFRTLPAEWITQAEIDAIRRFDPPLNIAHRSRDFGALAGVSG